MAKNLENANSNPLISHSRYIQSHRSSSVNTLSGLPQMLPTRPDSLPMRPTSRQRLSNSYHTSSSSNDRADAILTAQMGIHTKQPFPTVATAGNPKGEDHEPNLENLRRINRPPAVISTAHPVTRSHPVKRRTDARQVVGHSGSRGKMAGRGRGATRFYTATREDGRSHFIRAPERSHSASGRTPARANGPKQVVAPTRNDEESTSDMEIDAIDVFFQLNPSSAASTPTSQTKAEELSKPAHQLKFATPSFLQRNTVSRSAKYLSSVSNLSGDHQTPIHSFSSPQPPHRPHSERNSNPIDMIGTPLKRLSEEPIHVEVPPTKRKRSSASATTRGGATSNDFLYTEIGGAYQLHPNLHSLQQHSDLKHAANVHRGDRDRSDGHDDHLGHVSTNPSQQDHPDHASEAMSRPQASTKAEAALTPPFPFSASKRSSPQLTELGTMAMNPIVKQESIPSRSASPIDVNVPPLSLYEQLGLPTRTSGALRVPRPRFGKDERAKKVTWSKEVADSIRWVRGREGTIPPLIIGNVFWRPDGVSFDWEIPPEELIPRAVQEEYASKALDSAAITPNLDQVSGRSIPQVLPAHTSEISVRGPAAVEDIIPPTLPPLPTSRQTNVSPIKVKEEAPDIFLLPSGASALSFGQADAVFPRPPEDPPQTPQFSPNTIKAEALTLILSRTPQIPDVSNINTPALPVTAPSLPTNPAFESPDALSNIATCFLDRYTRCFDHIKSRSKLSEAYTEDAVMSLQFNDLPTEGSCPRVGQPRRQSHAIVNYADRDLGRNLLLDSDRDPKDRQYRWRTKTSLGIGSQSIASRLATFEALSHTPSPSSSRAYQFMATPIKELGLLMLEYSGELYATKANSEERYVSLRFRRTFIMRPNEPDAVSWVDWPWVITNDQMTLFHRPGIVCQCPP